MISSSGGGPRVSSGKGTSKQDYKTPREFLDKVEARFGRIRFDLAADMENCVLGSGLYKRPPYFSATDSAFGYDWNAIEEGDKGRLLWLNPPFDNVGPFAKKCAHTIAQASERNVVTRIAMLVPASVGSNWFRDYVWQKSAVFFLNGRICFDGKNPYPKDCLLAIYDRSKAHRAEIWSWKV